MQLYDITIAANTTRQLDAPGSYFYYYAGSAGGADSTITLRGLSSGLRLILKPGQAFRLPKGQTENAWVLTNYANTATIIGSVLVGDGDVTDNRITGSVEVIDGGKNRTISNAAFVASFGVGPIAAAYSHGQIWNPAGSGKNAYVSGFLAMHGGQGIMVRTSTVQLATLSGTPISKNFGSAVTPAATMRTENNAAILGVRDIFNFAIAANTFLNYQFKEPILLTPGTGLLVIGSTVNVGLNLTVEFTEENV